MYSRLLQQRDQPNICFSKYSEATRKACQCCALCGVPPPKWTSIPGDAALSNISRFDVTEKCATSSALQQQGSSDLGSQAPVIMNIFCNLWSSLFLYILTFFLIGRQKYAYNSLCLTLCDIPRTKNMIDWSFYYLPQHIKMAKEIWGAKK